MHHLSNDDYWQDFYKSHAKDLILQEPTAFARHCVELIDKEEFDEPRIADLGCGNGRDSIYLAKALDAEIRSVDRSTEAISHLSKLAKSMDLDITPRACDITDLEDWPCDIVYSRFFLHAIPETKRTQLIEWARCNMRGGGLFCVEFRTVFDELAKTQNDHMRDFISPYDFLLDTEDWLFPVEAHLSRGLAKYKDEDPLIMRFVGRKI